MPFMDGDDVNARIIRLARQATGMRHTLDHAHTQQQMRATLDELDAHIDQLHRITPMALRGLQCILDASAPNRVGHDYRPNRVAAPAVPMLPPPAGRRGRGQPRLARPAPEAPMEIAQVVAPPVVTAPATAPAAREVFVEWMIPDETTAESVWELLAVETVQRSLGDARLATLTDCLMTSGLNAPNAMWPIVALVPRDINFIVDSAVQLLELNGNAAAPQLYRTLRGAVAA